MIDIAKAKVGDKVHYMKGDSYENGIIKEIPENQLTAVRVVYNCGGNWTNYKDYTSALTPVDHLYSGWKHEKINYDDYTALDRDDLIHF